MIFQVPVNTAHPSGRSTYPISLRATSVPRLPVSVICGLLTSRACPLRTMLRSVQQQKLARPESGLIAPDASGVRTNAAPPWTLIATRCFVATGPPAATVESVAAAAARAATAFTLSLMPLLLDRDDDIRGERDVSG